MAGEDDHLEMAYEDRYTTQADWDAEDDDLIDDDEERDSDEELLEPARPAGYQGRHRAGIL